jgi:hypothetical protein
LVESAPLLFPSLSPGAPTCRGFFYCAKSPSLKGPPANVSFDSLMPNERGYLEFRGKDGDGGEDRDCDNPLIPRKARYVLKRAAGAT